MESGDILAWCIVGLMLTAVLAVFLLALYLMTEGVEGIGRRLYAMLLLLLSAVVAGVVVGAPIVLCAVALWMGLFAVAAAVGIPFGVVIVIAMAAAHAVRAAHTGPSPQGRKPRDSWVTAYLEWIKRVAGRSRSPRK